MQRKAPTSVITPGKEEIILSLPETLLCKAEALADEMNLTRDELIKLALNELIERQQAYQEARKQITSAYTDYPDENEQIWQAAMRERQSKHLAETEIEEGEGC